MSELPMLTIWGDADTLTPIDGPVGRYLRERARSAPKLSFQVVNAGHVPHDDDPESVNALLSEWLRETQFD